MSATKTALFTKHIVALTAAGMDLKTFTSLSAKDAKEYVLTLGNNEGELDLEGESNPQVYANFDIVLNGRPARITGIRLDSDYVQYLDKEHTKPNATAVSLLKTIQNKGAEYCNEHAEFRVTIQVQGESNSTITNELF